MLHGLSSWSCELVAGLLDGGPDGGVVVVEAGLGWAGDAKGTDFEDHVDGLDSWDLLDLFGDRGAQWPQVMPVTG